jgi:hypothetical protein
MPRTTGEDHYKDVRAVTLPAENNTKRLVIGTLTRVILMTGFINLDNERVKQAMKIVKKPVDKNHNKRWFHVLDVYNLSRSSSPLTETSIQRPSTVFTAVTYRNVGGAHSAAETFKTIGKDIICKGKDITVALKDVQRCVKECNKSTKWVAPFQNILKVFKKKDSIRINGNTARYSMESMFRVPIAATATHTLQNWSTTDHHYCCCAFIRAPMMNGKSAQSPMRVLLSSSKNVPI